MGIVIALLMIVVFIGILIKWFDNRPKKPDSNDNYGGGAAGTPDNNNNQTT